MQSNEEYLDSLLKAAMGEDEQQMQQPEETGMEEQKEEDFDPNKALSPEEIEAMFANMDGTEAIGEEAGLEELSEEPDWEAGLEELSGEPGWEAGSEELPEESGWEAGSEELLGESGWEAGLEELSEEPGQETSPEELSAELPTEPENDAEEPEDEEASLEELLKELGASDELPEELSAAEFPETGEAGDELWDGLAGDDDEMAEINELLSQSDSGNMLDDDMLALLEGTTEHDGFQQGESQGAQEADEIDIFALDALQEDEEEEEEAQKQDQPEQKPEPPQEEKAGPKKEKKGWFGKGKKKKEQKKEEAAGEGKEEELSGLELTEEGLLDITAVNEQGEAQEIAEIREKKQKKPGFFSGLMDFLMEEEEEEEEEEAPKKEKKKKEKKKGKQAKGPASEENEAILEELAEEDKKNEKKKKPKKAKKAPKEKKQEEEPSKEDGKKLPKKMVIRIFVMCFSFMILLIIPALLLPEVFSLRDARKAYYNEDYKTAYENLIGKKLNSSDSLMLEKATILMRLQRKYDSFVNYHKMGKETEALNALLEGCNLYILLQEEAQEQGVSKELEEIHQDLLDNLEYLYGVTEDQAGVLISIEDDAVYTEEVERLAGSGDEITGGSVPAYRSDAEEQPAE